MLLLASALQNPNQEAVENAAVWVKDTTILFAGNKAELPEEAKKDSNLIDLGNQVILPGLVNAHAHLELTALKNLPYPGSFVAWIREILAAKNNLGPEAQKKSLPEGVLESLRGGTTTIGDHISITGDLESLLSSPLRGKAFIEVLGVVPEVSQDIFNAALTLKKSYEDLPSLFEIIPSPHSIHALAPNVLAEILQAESSVFSIHLEESAEEHLYFHDKTGPMFNFIAERGSHLTRPALSAIQELNAMGQLDSRILAIHANYLTAEEIHLLSQKEISIVHCPFSHRYFSHQAFQMENCLKAKINLALGTDSLASGESLSMFDVMRATAKDFPLTRERVFEMATQGGAKALKLEDQVGEIVSGKKADLIAVPNLGKNPLESIFNAKEVSFSMIDGKVLVNHPLLSGERGRS